MNAFRFSMLSFLLIILSCQQPTEEVLQTVSSTEITREALLTTRFNSLEELKEVIQIEYGTEKDPFVRLSQISNGKKVVSLLTPGVSETDFVRARVGSLWDRITLGLSAPYAVANREDLLRILYLGRRRHRNFREGDVAFYDLAESMVSHMIPMTPLRPEDLTEKGYLNTFNHITAQALMTTIFSERMADFISDIHERKRLPELITGKFTAAQIADINNGPVDNYVDIINNEWGQELGKRLKRKYNINRSTVWTPELLCHYLNDVQSYFSWSFQIGFEPFRIEDTVVKRYASKMDFIMKRFYDFL